MIAVAIIAVLAGIVVPSWMRETRKTKGKAEVTAMFAELRLKEEQYRSDNNVYLAAAECPSTGPTSAGYNAVTICKAADSDWDKLRVQPSETTLRCSYKIEVGTASDPVTAPTGFTVPATTVATSWYTILATCDEDGQGGTNAQFFTSSLDPKTDSINEGQ